MKTRVLGVLSSSLLCACPSGDDVAASADSTGDASTETSPTEGPVSVTATDPASEDSSSTGTLDTTITAGTVDTTGGSSSDEGTQSTDTSGSTGRRRVRR
jgi:hypothetical protein